MDIQRLRFSENFEHNELASFFFKRIYYKTNIELIEIYNREIEIDEVLGAVRSLYFIILDRVFNTRFGKSPMEIFRDDLTIKFSGKIYLTNIGFELVNKESCLKVIKRANI